MASGKGMIRRRTETFLCTGLSVEEMPLNTADEEFLKKLSGADLRGIKAGPTYFEVRRGLTREGGNSGSIPDREFRERLWRILNLVYVRAFEDMMIIEKALGTDLRDDALILAARRIHYRCMPAGDLSFQTADSLWTTERQTASSFLQSFN
jgi:hypothetical protein